MPNATPETTLSARNLTRRFGNLTVIYNVSLELKRGEVLGLLGHNGAGKTTTLQMLTGCLLPNDAEQNQSSIDICGINLLKSSMVVSVVDNGAGRLLSERRIGIYCGLFRRALPPFLKLLLFKCIQLGLSLTNRRFRDGLLSGS